MEQPGGGVQSRHSQEAFPCVHIRHRLLRFSLIEVKNHKYSGVTNGIAFMEVTLLPPSGVIHGLEKPLL